MCNALLVHVIVFPVRGCILEYKKNQFAVTLPYLSLVSASVPLGAQYIFKLNTLVSLFKKEIEGNDQELI